MHLSLLVIIWGRFRFELKIVIVSNYSETLSHHFGKVAPYKNLQDLFSLPHISLLELDSSVRGRLTAPVGIKVSVEVDSDAAASLADGAVLPPHPVLRQTNTTGAGRESG